MICRTRRSGCGLTTANTRFETAAGVRPRQERENPDVSSGARPGRPSSSVLIAAAVCVALSWATPAGAEIEPEVGRMLDRAVLEAEEFRKKVQTLEYDATMRVQEWDGRGRLRGTARATAIMRPGAARPMTFLSREINGKVRLPEGKENKKDDDEKDVTLQQFAADHRISERFEFTLIGNETIAGEKARRVEFKPRPNQPAKKTADRFLNTIRGTVWVGESSHKLVKFEMRMLQPFQLFWIFAVLKDLKIEYELISPDAILGHAKLKVLFALTTPVYSIRQLHDVEIDNFRPRNMTVAFTAAGHSVE